MSTTSPREPEVCGGTGDHAGQSVRCCDECCTEAALAAAAGAPCALHSLGATTWTCWELQGSHFAAEWITAFLAANYASPHVLLQ